MSAIYNQGNEIKQEQGILFEQRGSYLVLDVIEKVKEKVNLSKRLQTQQNFLSWSNKSIKSIQTMKIQMSSKHNKKMV